MSRLKAYIKAFPIYWRAKREHARRKYAQAIRALAHDSVHADAVQSSSETVLIFSSMGIFADHLVVDTLLARELMRQGAKVIVVLCDAQLPVCHVSDRYSYAFSVGANGRTRRQKKICENCVGATQELIQDSGITYAFYSDGLKHASQLQMPDSSIDVSDEIDSGVIRFAASSHPNVLRSLPDDIYPKYALGASIALRAIDGLFNKYQPTKVIAHHGIYLPQGIVQKVARQHQVVFYSWHFGYRKSTLIFSRGDTYHRELIAAQPAAFDRALEPLQRERILNYLHSRMTGGQDWIHFNRVPKPFDAAGSPRGYFVFYTSVDWDAALHFPASVFSSQFDFLDKLIEVFRRTPDYDLIIRVHPAEVTGFHPAALSADDHLKTHQLPSNVRVISARDTTSSYDLAKNCVAAIVYNTKLGLELPPVGIPVIVAGDCWIRGKGFSYDVGTLTDLEGFICMGSALTVTDDQRERALQFAYYFYYRRCVDTPELTSAGSKFQVTVSAEGMQRVRTDGSGFRFIAARVLHGEHVLISA